MQKFSFLVLTFLLIGTMVFAQKANIEGTVKSRNGETLPGTTILVKGTTNGTLTDEKGHFTLQAEARDILSVSFIGFETLEVAVGNQKVISIILDESKEQIKEVVITALGIERPKSTIGFAVQDIKGSELVKAREPNPINALTGKIAGLTVGASAELLGAPVVMLRGYTPLYVIDGVPVQTDTWNINPDDIESYTVLKGPAAAALYGSRGDNTGQSRLPPNAAHKTSAVSLSISIQARCSKAVLLLFLKYRTNTVLATTENTHLLMVKEAV